MLAFCWATRHDPFFWDTIQLGSKHAHFFYENGLKWRPLPPEIDSGHPPVFGYYLALVWTLFGKTLAASHFAMLPFLWLNVILLWRIGVRIAGRSFGQWLPLLVFLDPVLLGQSAMVSPDIVVIGGFLLSLEGILGQRKWWTTLGILGLCAISMRGMMTAAALTSWVGIYQLRQGFNLRRIFFSMWPFIPGFAFAAWFLWWHALAAGWTGYHSGSPWAGAFKRVDMAGFIRNIAIVGWRWLDYGRVGEWMVLAGLLYGRIKWWWVRFKKASETTPSVWSLLVCLLVFLLPSALLYQNLSAHRYFLPAFVTFHLLVFQMIAEYGAGNMEGELNRHGAILPGGRARAKQGLLAVLLILMLTGNFWIYPRGVSMDWDSTLAHWPYHRLRQQAVAFLETNNIDFQTVGSAFPNLNTGENLLLNGDQRLFTKMDLNRNQYILASNIFNDINEADYAVLARDWTILWQKKKNGVWMGIFERR